jgi:electron transport complex protein RnfC
MGFTVLQQAAPVIKTTNSLLAATANETGKRPGPVLPCIRCGACASACPVSLLPQQLYWHARAKDFDKAQDYKLFDCIECGCCAYVCPSNLPLVQFFRFAKTEIWTQERERKKADLARERHEFRQERIDREKAERAARMKRKQAEAAKEGGGQTDDKKAAIKAAMERAKVKRAASAAEPRNTENLTEAQQRQIAEVEARRAAYARSKKPTEDTE